MDNSMEFVSDPHNAVISEETVVEDAEQGVEYKHTILDIDLDAGAEETITTEGEGCMYERCPPQLAAKLLQTVPEDRCHSAPPEKPKHGNWYMFSYLDDPKKQRLWHRDGMSWQNHGLKKEQHGGCMVHKRYFREENGTLCRLVFELVYPTKLNRLLVQYIDDTLVSKTIVFKHRTKFKRHNINKEANRRKLFSALSDWQASELLVSAVKGSCCTTPANKPTNGYWYIFKCEQDPSKSGNWQQDGLKWQQNCSSTVQVGPALMLKRQYVRVVDGTPVDFHRYSYEFVNPAAASLAGLGVAPQTDTNANSTTSPFPTPTVFHPSLSPEVEHQSSPLKVEQLEEDDETLEQVTPTKINPSKKRRNSFRWTPSKKAKARKIRSSQAFDNEVVVDNGRECTEYPLHRVLVHYLGNSDAESAPSAIKKRSASRSGNKKPQVAMCRAVPLVCADGCLQTSLLGVERGIHRLLTLREAAHLLASANSCLPKQPLAYPRAGLWCAVQCDGSETDNGWSNDGHSWRCWSQERYLMPQGKSFYCKRYRRTVRGTSVHLYRYVYYMPEVHRDQALVHYLGLDDEPDSEQTCAEQERQETGFMDADTWPLLVEADGGHGKADTTAVLCKDKLSVMVITRLLLPLEMDTVRHLLEETPEEDCLTFAPTNPTNGHWFVFTYKGLRPVYQKAWKKDTLKWRHNGTHKKPIHDGKCLNIRYYKRMFSKTGGQFMRYTYEIVDSSGNNFSKRILVHYLGKDDMRETLFESSYSNKLKIRLGIGTPVHVRIGDLNDDQFYTVQCNSFLPDCIECPSIEPITPTILVDELESHTSSQQPKKINLVSGFDSSNNFFYEEVVSTSDPEELPTLVCENASPRYNVDEADTSVDSGLPYVYRIERNALYFTNNFLHKIKDTHSIFYQLVPTTIVIIACKANLAEFKAIAPSSGTTTVLFYDKLWKVEGLYVTCLYTRHVNSEMESLFPIAFAIYELDDTRSHTVILETLLSQCKFAEPHDIVLLTDASQYILAACREVLPENFRVAASWVNIFEAIKFWFSKNEPLAESWPTVDTVNTLLQTQSEGEYNANYQVVSMDWSVKFKAFYDENLLQLVATSNVGGLIALGMHSRAGLTIQGNTDFLEQMDYVTDTDLTSVDALSHVAYYMLYFYHNEIEKGKLLDVTSNFKVKSEFAIPNIKKKCFFPSRCALSDDVAASILHKLRVPEFAFTREPNSLLMEDGDENIRELCNIEIDLDEDIFRLINQDEKKCSPLEMTALVDDIVNPDYDSDENYQSYISKDEEEETLQPFEQRVLNGVEFTNESVVLEEIIEDSSKTFVNKNRLQPSGLRKKSSSTQQRKKQVNSREYMRRKKVVNAGHSLWNTGLVSHDTESGTYMVRGRNTGRVEAVHLHPRRTCSCGKNKRVFCEHIVSAMLEGLCQGDANTEDIPPQKPRRKSTPKSTLKPTRGKGNKICNGKSQQVHHIYVDEAVADGDSDERYRHILQDDEEEDDEGYDVIIGGE